MLVLTKDTIPVSLYSSYSSIIEIVGDSLKIIYFNLKYATDIIYKIIIIEAIPPIDVLFYISFLKCKSSCTYFER